MFFDLNIPWPSGPQAQQTVENELKFAEELGYDVVAINITVCSTKEAKEILTKFTPEIYKSLQAKFSGLKILRRVTIDLMDSRTNLAQVSTIQTEKESVSFDLVAAIPHSEKQLQQCANALDIDLIVVDGKGRLPYPLRHKLVGAAIKRGIRFEILYSKAFSNAQNCIANASSLFRVSRGRGVVASSGGSIEQLRSPLDVVNLIGLWGLKQTAARDALERAPYAAATQGILRAKSVKQAVRKRQILDSNEPKKKVKTV